MKKISLLLLSIASLGLLSACQSSTNHKTEAEKVVVVYTSVDQVFSEPVLQAFEKKTGIKVKAVYDTEETKSTGVLNRIIAEKNHPRCDVFWSGDPMRTAVLKKEGLLQAYCSPTAKDIPSVFKDNKCMWTGFSARARVLLYNKTILNENNIPHSIFDLTKPTYKGQFAIANPLFGTTTFHLAALFDILGETKAKALLDALKQNGVVIATSNGDVKQRVVSGEVACGLTDTDDAFEAVKESKDVSYVFLDQGDSAIGTLIIPNTVCLIKGSPHTEYGKKLIDYLLQCRTEQILAKSCAQMPLHKGCEVPKNVPSLDKIKPMAIDYDKTAKILEKIQPYLEQWEKSMQ